MQVSHGLVTCQFLARGEDKEPGVFWVMGATSYLQNCSDNYIQIILVRGYEIKLASSYVLSALMSGL